VLSMVYCLLWTCNHYVLQAETACWWMDPCAVKLCPRCFQVQYRSHPALMAFINEQFYSRYWHTALNCCINAWCFAAMYACWQLAGLHVRSTGCACSHKKVMLFIRS
jgi:hypothetical protein